MPDSPDGPWRVHDPDRPQPPEVTPPGEEAPYARDGAPSDAIVLLGPNLDESLAHWCHLDGRAVEWQANKNELVVVPRSGDIQTRVEFSDCQLHVEWRAPEEIKARSQGRGNSGVFLLGRYEIQVLDSYQNPTYADGAAGALYGQHPPRANACVAPGEWQRYDIVFEAPRFDGQALIQPAYMTVFHNNVLLHHRQRLDGPTRHRELASYAEPHPSSGPLVLQDHRDEVAFRNIWLRPLV